MMNMINKPDWGYSFMERDKPDRTKTSLTISTELHKTVKMLAVLQGRDVSEIYEEALRDVLVKHNFSLPMGKK